MHAAKLQPPLGHHISGHRAVDAAGNQYRRLARGADGDSPRPRQLLSVDVGRRLPDFYHYQHIRMLYVYFQMRIALQNPTAQLPADFR